MANSGTVTAGSAALASQYNNLRDDVLNVSTGHTHSGSADAGARIEGTAIKSTGATAGFVLTAGVGGTATTFAAVPASTYYVIGTAGAFYGTAVTADAGAYVLANAGTLAFSANIGGTFTSLAENGGMAYATALSGVGLITNDGASWTAGSVFSGVTWRGATFGGSTFVIVGQGGYLSTSTDGTAWTTRTSSFDANNIFDVAYAGGTFVASGQNSNSGASMIATSTSVDTWTQRTTAMSAAGLRIAFGTGIWVNCSNNGAIQTSPDAINWTNRTAPLGSGTAVYALEFGGTVFVAAGAGGKLSTSADGTAWTARTSSFSSSIISGVAYSGSLWVIVGASGKAATSTDATTWTLRTTPTANGLESVWYGNGTFIAVTDISGTADNILVSYDGITWTLRNSAAAATMYAGAFGSGRHILVGTAKTSFTTATPINLTLTKASSQSL